MVDSSPAATVGSLSQPTPAFLGITSDSSSSHYFGPKLSIKLQDNNNYLIWNQQVKGVILTQRVYKIVVTSQIPPKLNFEQDRIDAKVIVLSLFNTCLVIPIFKTLLFPLSL